MEDAPTGQLARQDESGQTGASDTNADGRRRPSTAPGGSSARPDTAPEDDRRTGGRRYRAGRPTPELRPAYEWPRAQATPFPSGLGARGTLGGLFAGCLLSCLLAAWLHLVVLAGLGFCAGSGLAAWYCRPSSLLRMVMAVPAVFAVAEILAQLVILQRSGRHGLALPVAGGTLLMLAAVAPWLFAGTAAAVAIALYRGLPRCIRDLRTELRGRAPAGRPARAQQTARAPRPAQAQQTARARRPAQARQTPRT